MSTAPAPGAAGGDGGTTSCLFCRIVRGEIPARSVFEAPDVLAFRDITPQAPVHILVIPRVHIGSLDEATDPQLLGRLTHVAAEIARREGLAAAGYRVVINTREDGGQTVGHLHLHLLGGRRMLWPPG
jgi:histidine triad (HIT) family protein